MLSNQPSSAVSGIWIMVAATITFALQDALTKKLTVMMPVGQILFVRFVAFALFVTLYLASRSKLRTALRSKHPFVQIFRVMLLFTEMALFAFTVRFLGLAEMHAIMSSFPLVVTALAVPLLGESVGWRRWAAVVIGFIGTLIILQPGIGVFNPYSILALCCATLFGLYTVFTRRVASFDSFETSMLYFAFVGLIASTIIGVAGWQAVPSEAYYSLAALCVISIASHMMLTKALSLAPAVVLQPFTYLILVWAVLIGLLYFKETLSAITIAGMVIVVGSGLYIGYREYRLSGVATTEQ